MTKMELNILVEKLILIRDMGDTHLPLLRSERQALADACNVIYDNLDILADDVEKPTNCGSDMRGAE